MKKGLHLAILSICGPDGTAEYFINDSYSISFQKRKCRMSESIPFQEPPCTTICSEVKRITGFILVILD